MKINLPIGFYEFHENNLLNFQLNRFYSSGLITYEKVVEAAKKIKDFESFKKVFGDLADAAVKDSDYLSAAVFYRGAEFFALGNDPDKQNLYKLCMEYYRKAFQDEPIIYESVPYENGYLPVMKILSKNPKKGTILLHGGYDSFMQEFCHFCLKFADAGYNVIMFEGPGQGGALYDSKIAMTSEWEKPTSTIIDFYNLENITLIGISLGGYLAARASAFDKRIQRVVLYDVVYDYYGAVFQKAQWLKKIVDIALKINIPFVFRIMDSIVNKNLFAKWMVLQGYHIFGIDNLKDYYRTIKKYQTKKFSNRITQDVLILAGEEDLYTCYFEKQKKALTNARSVEGRIFTKEEHASHHCQVGNIGLALDYIIDWIDERRNHVDI